MTLSEIDDLRYRVAELERHLDDYHDMIEGRMQWEGERLLHEVYGLLNLVVIGAATGLTIMISNWLNIESKLVEGIVVVVVWLAATGFGASWSEKKRDEAIKSLPQPWKYVRKPSWRKNYD